MPTPNPTAEALTRELPALVERVPLLATVSDEEAGRLVAYLEAACTEAIADWSLETRVRRLYADLQPELGRDGAIAEIVPLCGVGKATVERILWKRWTRQPEHRATVVAQPLGADEA